MMRLRIRDEMTTRPEFTSWHVTLANRKEKEPLRADPETPLPIIVAERIHLLLE